MLPPRDLAIRLLLAFLVFYIRLFSMANRVSFDTIMSHIFQMYQNFYSNFIKTCTSKYYNMEKQSQAKKKYFVGYESVNHSLGLQSYSGFTPAFF